MTTITLHNAQRRLRVPLDELKRFAHVALELCPKPLALTSVEVIFVSDRRIAELHRKFMNISGPTDVITFQHGEIFISVDTAKANARRFKSSTNGELKLYIVHGLLHLLGFDDTTPAAARRMETVQQRIFSKAERESGKARAV